MHADRHSALNRELHDAGLRATRPRQLVLALLRDLGDHHAADDVVTALAGAGTPLPRGSVYVVLAALAEHGLIALTDAGRDPVLYEAKTAHHHHFVCAECGAVVDVACPVGSRRCLEVAGAPGEGEETQVVLRGRCPACLSAQPGSRRRSRARRAGRNSSAVA